MGFYHHICYNKCKDKQHQQTLSRFEHRLDDFRGSKLTLSQVQSVRSTHRCGRRPGYISRSPSAFFFQFVLQRSFIFCFWIAASQTAAAAVAIRRLNHIDRLFSSPVFGVFPESSFGFVSSAQLLHCPLFPLPRNNQCDQD